MNCPVCKKKYKNKMGSSSHLFKTKDNSHKEYVLFLKKRIKDLFYTDKSCVKVAEELNCSSYYVCKIWELMPNYKQRKSKANSAARTKEWKNKKRLVPIGLTNKNYKYNFNHKHTITKDQHDKIICLFKSDLTIKSISKIVGCDKKTIKSVWIKIFSKTSITDRAHRIKIIGWKKGGISNGLKHKNPEKYQKVINCFNNCEGMRVISKKLMVGTGTIKKVWLENFGKEKYEERVSKMLKLQRIRASKSLKKAKFLGSKNEILCYNLLKKAIPYEVIHHDYSVVPRLEIDISIPKLKFAVCWDGIGHRKPVFGEKAFKRIQKNDSIRKKVLKEKDWSHISIIDDGGYNPKFVKNVVKKIIKLTEKDRYDS